MDRGGKTGFRLASNWQTVTALIFNQLTPNTFHAIHGISHGLCDSLSLTTGFATIFKRAHTHHTGELCGIKVVPNTTLEALSNQQVCFTVDFRQTLTFISDHWIIWIRVIHIVHFTEQRQNALKRPTEGFPGFIHIAGQLSQITFFTDHTLRGASQVLPIRPMMRFMIPNSVTQFGHCLIGTNPSKLPHLVGSLEVLTPKQFLDAPGIAARLFNSLARQTHMPNGDRRISKGFRIHTA